MSKFKIGDKVKVDGYKLLDGEIGVVVDINPEKYGCGWMMIEFETAHSFMHDGDGKGKANQCYLMPNHYLEIINDKVTDEVTVENDIHATTGRLADLCTEYAKLGRKSGIPLEALLLGVKLAYDGMWDK